MRAGGFPEDLFLFFEDLELCLAHRRRGGRVAIDSQWAIRHPDEHGPLEGRDSLDAIARQSGRWFARRHQGRCGPRSCTSCWRSSTRRAGVRVLLRQPAGARRLARRWVWRWTCCSRLACAGA